MASASPIQSESAAGTQQRSEVPSLQATLRPAVQFAGFWAAVVLPFVLLTLIATGSVTQHPTLAAGVVAGNTVGLMLGRGYKR